MYRIYKYKYGISLNLNIVIIICLFLIFNYLLLLFLLCLLTNREKQTLRADAELCKRKMEAASTLINGLSGEKIRWTAQSREFKMQIGKLRLVICFPGSSSILL